MKNKELLLTLSTYIVTHCLILFVHGAFWDDWTIYNNTLGIEEEFFHGNGGVVIGNIHLFLQSIPIEQTLLYHGIIFITGSVSVILLYLTLCQIKELHNDKIWLSLLYACFPYGYSRITMICLPYQLGILFFLFSTFLYFRYYPKQKRLLCLFLIVPVFLSSLFLPSTILLWFGVLCLDALFRTQNWANINLEAIKQLIKELFERFIYFIPCLIFWGLKQTIWQPEGLYASEGYNSLSIKYLILSPIFIMQSFLKSIAYIFHQISWVFDTFYILIFILIVCVLLYTFRNESCFVAQKNKYIEIWTSLFIFICGAAPYVLVGKVPQFDSVNDRFNILIVFAICPLIYYLISSFINSNAIKKYILIFFLAIFSANSVSQYLEAMRLSQRNDAIMLFFKNTKLPDGNVFVSEECPRLRSNYYSWSGLYHKATGLQDRCFACIETSVIYDDDEYLNNSCLQRDAKKGLPKIGIALLHEATAKGTMNTIRGFYLYYLNHEKYNEFLQNTYAIRSYEFKNSIEL